MERGAPFPKDISEFDQDERISYSRAEGKFLLVDDSNEEWEFNEAEGKWFQPATEEQIAAYQQAYGGPADADADEPVPAPAEKKRKKAPTTADANKKPKVQENRAIYITNLPRDATAQEIEDEFSKYGMIDQGVDGTKRIKMYADDNGEFKGEALVVYFKKDSVAMAIKMMDDYWFRPGEGPNISVQAADMSYKKIQDGQEVSKTFVRKDKKANERNRAEMNRRLAEWSDDDEVAKETFAPPTNKWAKVVIIKHAFTLEELDKDPAAIADIKEDMREEAEPCGEVTNVVLFDREPEGIITVRFKETSAAEAFAKKINGRGFSGRKLDVKVADDRPKFKKSGKGTASDEEEEAERLEKFINDKE